MTVLLVAAKRELIETKLTLLADVGPRAQRHRRRRLRAAQRLRAELSRRDARRGRPGEHRPRNDQREHPRRRRPGPHPRHPDRHPPVPRGPAARAGHVRRRGRPAAAGLRAQRGAGAVPGSPAARSWRSASSARRRSSSRRSRSASGPGPALHLGRRRRAFPASTACSADRLRLPVQPANPLERLQVADGVFDTMVVDEVAPLLMLPDRPRAPFGGVTPRPGPTTMMIAINLKPGLKRKRAAARRSPGVGERVKALARKVQGPAARRVAAGVARRGRLGSAASGSAAGGSSRALEPQLEQARTENQRFKALRRTRSRSRS